MKFLTHLRDHLPVGGNPAGPRDDDEAKFPIGRYDRLSAERVNEKLRALSQVELETVETYERAHQDRPVVLRKLRYLRGPEPIEGYDALEEDDVPAALEGADMETLDGVRDYERKLRRRTVVLEGVGGARRELQAIHEEHAGGGRNEARDAETMRKLEAGEAPTELKDWPSDSAMYKTYGSEDDEPYGEGQTAKLGPSELVRHADGSISIRGEKVDNPEDYKGKPIPGGPTDPDNSG